MLETGGHLSVQAVPDASPGHRREVPRQRRVGEEPLGEPRAAAGRPTDQFVISGFAPITRRPARSSRAHAFDRAVRRRPFLSRPRVLDGNSLRLGLEDGLPCVCNFQLPVHLESETRGV